MITDEGVQFTVRLAGLLLVVGGLLGAFYMVRFEVARVWIAGAWLVTLTVAALAFTGCSKPAPPPIPAPLTAEQKLQRYNDEANIAFSARALTRAECAKLKLDSARRDCNAGADHDYGLALLKASERAQ